MHICCDVHIHVLYLIVSSCRTTYAKDLQHLVKNLHNEKKKDRLCKHWSFNFACSCTLCNYAIHCKNVRVISTLSWLPQLHPFRVAHLMIS